MTITASFAWARALRPALPLRLALRLRLALPLALALALALALVPACASPDSPDPKYPSVTRREAKACRRLADERADEAYDAAKRGSPTARVRGTGADDGLSFAVTGALAIGHAAKATRVRDRTRRDAMRTCVEDTARAHAPTTRPTELGPESSPASTPATSPVD